MKKLEVHKLISLGNNWKNEVEIRINGRTIIAYSKGNKIKLKYKDTGQLITTVTLSAESYESRDRYRHIVSKIRPYLNEKDEFGSDNMAGWEKSSGAGRPGARMPEVRGEDTRGTGSVLYEVSGRDAELTDLDLPGESLSEENKE